MRKVTELILEQVECADYILLNKVDLVKKQSDIDLMIKILGSINPTAKVYTCAKGKVDPLTVVGNIGGVGAADSGVLDEHRTLVESVDHEHNHGHSHSEHHDHSHSHEHDNHAENKACMNTDPTHVHGESCGHEHSHDRSHSSDTSCSNTDPTHVHDENCGHGHSHDHNHDATTAEKR